MFFEHWGQSKHSVNPSETQTILNRKTQVEPYFKKGELMDRETAVGGRRREGFVTASLRCKENLSLSLLWLEDMSPCKLFYHRWSAF